ncbi:MAG TPA: hypothetical protein VFY65_01825 [Longimicrobium sp.]|nr:hypothetical protein [Longimicrobium sp.]
MKLNLEHLVVDSFATSDVPQFASAEISTPQCPTPATICFICPPSKYTECELCEPTPMTICFICPPLTSDCAEA